MLGALAQAERAAFQGDARHGDAVSAAVLRRGHEQLPERRHRGPGAGAEVGLVDVRGDVAPAEHPQVLLGGDLLDPRHGGRGLLLVRGQERRAHRVLPGGGQREVDDGTQEGVGNLDQDAHAVAGVVLRAARTAVLEPQQGREAPADDLVVLAAREVGHQGDTAGVVLVLGGVHTGGRGNRPVARGSQEFLLSSRCTPTPASGRRSYVMRSVGCTRCTDQLVRSGEPDMSSPRTGESLRTAVGQSGRLGEDIGRPGYGSDRTQRRGRFSRSQASHAVRQERQRKSSERGDAARPCVSGVPLPPRTRGDHPVRPSRGRAVRITGCRTAGGRGRLGGVAGLAAWLTTGRRSAAGRGGAARRPRRDRAVLRGGHRRAAGGGLGAGRRAGGPARSARRPDRGRRGGAVRRPPARDRRPSGRPGGRIDRVPGHRGSGRRAAVRGGGGARGAAGRGGRRRRPGAALAPGGRGAVAVVARRGPASSRARIPPSSAPWSRSCSPRSSPPSGRRPRSPSGCCGATRRRPWRARGSWSRRSVRTPPRAPPPSAGTCSPRHRSRPRRRCATPHRPTSAGPSSAARAASTTGFRAAGSAVTACCAGRSAEPAPPEIAHCLSPRLDSRTGRRWRSRPAPATRPGRWSSPQRVRGRDPRCTSSEE